MKVRFTLDCNFAGAIHTHEEEFPDYVASSVLDEYLQEWANDCVNQYWEVIDDDV